MKSEEEADANRLEKRLLEHLGRFENRADAIEWLGAVMDGIADVDDTVQNIFNLRIISIHDWSFSQAALFGRPADTVAQRAYAARELCRARDAIVAVAFRHPQGRVLIGSTLKVRKLLLTLWKPPANADFVHFGALRGLDFARYHMAALSIGRQELPVRVYDGLAAALTYDDVEPQNPFDQYGDGSDENGRPLHMQRQPRLLRMKDGTEHLLSVPRLPDGWGALVQNQFREAELLQFVGRLRTVYRETADRPTWYALTDVPPDELVYDEVRTYDEVFPQTVAARALPEVARRCDGILSRELAFERCPDIVGEDGDAIASLFAEGGFDCHTGSVIPSLALAWTRLAWVNGEGDTIYAWASGFVNEPGKLLAEALSRADYEVVGCHVTGLATPTQALPRPPAKDDDEWLARSAGEDDERRALLSRFESGIEKGMFAMRSGPEGNLFQVRDGERGIVALSLDGWMAHRAITVATAP